MKKELRLRDLINVDYTQGDMPEDDLGLITYKYIKRHRGQIGEDSIKEMHINSWYEIIEAAPKEVIDELMSIAYNKGPVLSGSDKIKLEDIIQGVTDTKLQESIRRFTNTLEMIVYEKQKQEVNESNTSSYLEQLVKKDQNERNQYISFVKSNGGDYDQGSKDYAKKHGRKVDDIFGEKADNIGFITKAKGFQFQSFSEKDWKNFWLVCQHCDFDRNFQKWALDKIKKYLGDDNDHFKYLWDRVSCGLTGRQNYGTQDICTRDDTVNESVINRRLRRFERTLQ